MRILNFDNSVVAQKRLLELYHPHTIDLADIGRSARLWLNQRTASRISQSLNPDLKNHFTFLGSGDFHHVSSLLIGQFQQPLSVIIFDLHPDWDTLPPRLGCGSWVSRILERKNILKVILFAVASEDIAIPYIQSGNLKAFQGNRLEIFPYCHRPTRVFFRKVAQNISFAQKRSPFFTDIYWQQLKEKNLAQFTAQVMDRLPTKEVYVSIDKDCLKSAYALTNWEEGRFELEELLAMLRVIRERSRIAGLDITGEYSLPCFSGRLKAFFSRMDHPKDFTARGRPQEEINAVNEQTNLRLLEVLANGCSR